MLGLPLELQKLPPQALDVIRYLGRLEGGATTDQIIEDTGLSERSFGKAIRRLVTRYYVEMPAQGYYTLTASGQEAVRALREYDGHVPASVPADTSTVEQLLAHEPPGDPPAEPDRAPHDATHAAPQDAPQPEAVRWHKRRLSVFLPKELVERQPTRIRMGFDAPVPDAVPLTRPARVILRVSAPGCDVEPVERPLEVAAGAAAGPLDFRITPRLAGAVRVRVEIFQLVALDELIAAGGMFFDRNISGFPTPGSAEFQTLAAAIRLHPGQADA